MRRIAYQREDSCAPGSGQPQETLSIGVIGSDGSTNGGIGTQNTSYDVGAWFYAWSPDSTQLAFLDELNRLHLDRHPPGWTRLTDTVTERLSGVSGSPPLP